MPTQPVSASALPHVDRWWQATRHGFGIILPTLWIVTILLAFGLAWDRLPDAMASHWGLSGRPDNSLDKAVVLGALAAPAVAAAYGAWVWFRRSGAGPADHAPALTLATFVGLMMALLALTLVALNVDATEPWEAKDLSPLHALVLVGTAAAGGLAAGGVAHRLAMGPRLQPCDERRRTTWSGTASNGFLLLIAVLSTMATVWGALVLDRGAVWPTTMVAIVGLVFGRATVEIDGAGLRVRLGVLGVPRVFIPLGRIERASSRPVGPMDGDGWGYRTLTGRNSASIVIRRGQSITLELTDGETFVVTIDDAEAGVRMLDDLLATRRPDEALA